MRKYLTLIFMLMAIYLAESQARAQGYHRYDTDAPMRDTVREGYNVKDEQEAERDQQGDSSRYARLYVLGCNFGLSITPFYIDISPYIGYRLKPRWQVGVGLTYFYYNGLFQYIDPNNNVFSYRVSQSIFGARAYTEYDLTQNIFVHGEMEGLNVPYHDYVQHKDMRTWIGNELAGIGYRSHISRNLLINLTALYNFNYTNNQDINPYGSPWVIRMGLCF